MIINKYSIVEYLRPNGENPYRLWLMSLPESVQGRVQARLFRFEQGNLGDYRGVGHGVCEVRLQFGPGYRVYYGFDGTTVIVLLAGGDKRTQKLDIIKARKFWLEYKLRKRRGKAKY